jgi:hypothetical protein
MQDSTAIYCGPELWAQFSFNPLTGKLHKLKDDKIVKGKSSVDRRNYRKFSMGVFVTGKRKAMNYGRVVYAWLSGYLPGKGFHIDHINHNSADNRPWNLRCVTVRQNNQNRRNQGSAGIYWNVNRNKWQAQIRVDNARVYLGIHAKESEALAAYVTACDAHNYAVLPSVRQRLVDLKSANM